MAVRVQFEGDAAVTCDRPRFLNAAGALSLSLPRCLLCGRDDAALFSFFVVFQA